MDSSSSSQVQGTNDNSIVSKLSMVKFGYINDPYIEHFVDKYQRRSPLINRGYYLRAKGVRYVVEKFLKGVDGRKQIISLGCGFDTTYYWIKHNFPDEDFLFIEIDYKEVINRKLQLTKSFHQFDGSEVGCKFKDIIQLKTKDCCYVGQDLRNIGSVLFNQSLVECGIEKKIPTLVISEIVLTYLTASQSSRVLRWVDHYFDNAVMFVAEQMIPDDGFGRVMCKHFRSLSSPLLSIEVFPTLPDQEARHRKYNLGRLSSIRFNDLYAGCLDDGERRRIENAEMFDEFEGWHQMALHYFFLCSTNACENKGLGHLCENMFEKSPTCQETMLPQLTLSTLKENVDENSLEMFGHSMAHCNNQQVLIFGGFGIDSNGKNTSHQRLKTFRLFNKTTLKYNSLSAVGEIPPHLMHSSVVKVMSKPNTYEFIVFGGRSSPKHGSNTLYKLTLDTDNATVTFNEISINSDFKPPARWRHSATFCQDRNAVIIFGGKNKDTTFSDCWAFNLESLTWNAVDFPSLKPRHSHSVCWWKEQRVFVISGGLNNAMQPYNNVVLFSAKDETFERLDIRPPLNARYSHTSHVIDQDKLLLVGGVKFAASTNHERDTDVCVIDLSRGQWIRTIRFPAVNHSPLLLHGHASYVTNINDDVTEKYKSCDVIIIGGGANCFSFGTHFNKSPIRMRIEL